MLIGGVAFLGIAVLILIWRFKGSKKYIEQQGEIVSVRASTSKRSNNNRSRIYYPTIQYKSPNGEMLEIETGFGSSMLTNKIPGTKVPILVNRDKPEQIRPRFAGVSVLVTATIFAIPGMILIWVAFYQL